MKCAIFCLLAFCAFETVFADDPVDYTALEHSTSDSRIVDAKMKLNKDIWDASEAAKLQKIKTDEAMFSCWVGQNNYQLFLKSSNTKMDACYDCYKKNKKNMKSAENCCTKLANKVKKEAKSYLGQARTCISKCAQSEDNCLKEIRKQRKDLGME